MSEEQIITRWKELLYPMRFREQSPVLDHDGRNPFENDYARLIFSSSIRRLQDKTQVFPLEKSDFIRTRLTHSLEVSTIARSIGQSVEKRILKNINDKEIYGQLSSLLACAGLVHDLGNPPFGHFGETAIQEAFKEYFYENEVNTETRKSEKRLKQRFRDWIPQEIADFENFDGNVQTLRILRRLSYLKDEHSFNLTYPTLASIIKYPRNSVEGNKSNPPNIADKKFGYFFSEKDTFEQINSTLKLKNQRHPIIFLMEAADDIAYSAADIEDGVKVGSLSFETIYETFKTTLNLENPKQKALVDKLNEYSVYYKKFGNDNLSLIIQRFRIDAQGYMIGEVINEFMENQESILSGEYKFELLNRSLAKEVRKAFKSLSYKYFDNKVIIERELIGHKVLKGLLEMYLDVIFSPNFNTQTNSLESRLYKMISSNFRFIYTNYQQKEVKEDYRKIQLVTDFLSGMTDSYALEVYQKVSGIRF